MDEKESVRVSVIIPTYNRAEALRRCLDSLIGQTFKSFEVIVCDDGSTDETKGVVEEYIGLLDLTYDYAENFGGPARPRNRGLQLAIGEYIAFLDSDDWWVPQKLEESVRYLDKGEDLIYHDLFYVDKLHQTSFKKKVKTRPLRTPLFDDLIQNGNVITNSSVVVRQELLQKVGGFSEDKDFIAMEDYEAWLRISGVTDKFKRIPEPLGYYWAGGGNISNPERMLMNITAFEKKYKGALNGLGIDRVPYWMNYAAGKAHTSLQAYDEAMRWLLLIRVGNAPFFIYLKSRFLLLLLKFGVGKRIR